MDGGALLGLVACLCSSLAFGSMFVAVRKYDAGDGVFVQWCVCSAIYLVGIVVNCALGFPPFQPLAMLGGALWALGNLTAIPIIKAIGLGTGILIWGVVLCCVGWATGRFGLFGTKANPPASSAMNYLGVLLVIVGGVLFSMVRPKTRQQQESPDSSESPNVTVTVTAVGGRPAELESLMADDAESPPTQDSDFAAVRRSAVANPSDRANLKARFMAIAMALFAGCCYGLTFTPVIYIQDNAEKFHDPPKEAIKYVFSHFTGVYLTGSVLLIIYLAYTQNRPYVNPKIIPAALLGGLLWASAMLAWFVSNDLLSQAITFPINAMLPGVIASLWSVFYFKEVEGSRNLRLLVSAILITVTGVTMVGMSKVL